MIWLALLLACGGGRGDDPVGPGPDPIAALAEAGDPVSTQVGALLLLPGAGSTGASFRWAFGDGNGTAASGLPVGEHRYDAPGHYTAQLTATGSDGSQATDTVAVTVTWPAAAIPPTASSALAAVGDRIVAVQPDHDTLILVERDGYATSVLGTCGKPRSISAHQGLVAVACERDEVRLYDEQLAELARIDLPWGSRPFGAVVTHDGRVAVTLQGTGEVAWVDETGVVERVAVGPDLRGLASTSDGLIVSRHRSPDDRGQVWTVTSAGPFEWPLAPDPGPDSDTDARGVPTYLQRIAVRPDGRTAVLGGLKANVGRGLFLDGQALTHETTTRAVLRQLSLDSGEGDRGTELGEPPFDDRDLVSAMAYSPLGDWLYVAFLGAERVDIVDAYSMARVGGIHDVGHGPSGLWVSEDGQQLWVYAELSRELAVYDLTDPFATQVELARIDLDAGRPEPLGEQVLLGKITFTSAADTRMTATGYMSCTSCHLDGDHDGRTWDFTDRGEGLRNTISLLGTAGAAPLHWTANFDELQDFEGDIRGPMAGDGFLSEADWAATSDPLGAPKAGRSAELDALALYVESLDEPVRSPWRDADGQLPASAVAGRSLFESLATGCVNCHVPPTFTDSAFQGPGLPLLHDVGTQTTGSGLRLGQPFTGFDTPSLRGLHASAPYLHDGSFDTVRDLLVANQADDLHGTTSHLDPVQLDQLEAYLLSVE